MSLQDYRDFIANKAGAIKMAGFDPKPINAADKGAWLALQADPQRQRHEPRRDA